MLQTKVEAVPSAHLCWDPKDLLSWEWVSFHEVPYQLKQILIRKFNWLGTEDQFILRRQQRWFREHASLLVPSPFPTLDYEWGRHERCARTRSRCYCLLRRGSASLRAPQARIKRKRRLNGSGEPQTEKHIEKRNCNNRNEPRTSYLPPDLTSFDLCPQASQLVAIITTSLKCGIADILVKVNPV